MANADVAYVGGSAQYVILDEGFRRHVEASEVDRQVLRYMRDQMEPYKDVAVAEMMRMLGQDDLFTKVAIDSSLKNIDQALGHSLPEDARAWLGMLGFRIVVNVHGEVVKIDLPGQEGGWEE